MSLQKVDVRHTEIPKTAVVLTEQEAVDLQWDKIFKCPNKWDV